MALYEGESQHGYWWLHLNGQLMYTKNCHGVKPSKFFDQTEVVGWWKVRCQMDWYRMVKESNSLRETGFKHLIA